MHLLWIRPCPLTPRGLLKSPYVSDKQPGPLTAQRRCCADPHMKNGLGICAQAPHHHHHPPDSLQKTALWIMKEQDRDEEYTGGQLLFHCFTCKEAGYGVKKLFFCCTYSHARNHLGREMRERREWSRKNTTRRHRNQRSNHTKKRKEVFTPAHIRVEIREITLHCCPQGFFS